MNNTIINISGIHVAHYITRLEDSTDTADVLYIRDEHGNEVKIEIAFGKIINHEKNSSSIDKQ